MATFSKSTFNATKYAAARPHYPPALYSHVISYASSSSSSPRLLVDLGCGPGLSTFPFSSHFDQIIGIDPSKNMVDAANQIRREKEGKGEIEKGKFEFQQGKGDELEGIIEDESVDLVVAGQAAHWFDPLPTYRSLSRILKPRGSFCFWGYGEIFFPSRPELTKLIPPYSGGLLGPYWEQPGRSIVESLLIPFPLPISSNFPSLTLSSSADSSNLSSFDPTSLHRSFHLSSTSTTPSLLSTESDVEISTHPLLLEKEMSLNDLEAYLRTWSSLHKYNEEYRGEREAGKDVVGELLEGLKGEGWGEADKVEAAWEVGMVMGKKKTM